MTVKLRFSDIARHLRESIRTGDFAIGSVLPTELELSAHYQTSRHTIRAALQELQQLGLVSRRKNAGTRVESVTPTAGFQQSLASINDLVHFGATHSRVQQQIDTVTASAELACLLDCAEGTPWLRIASLRFETDASGTRAKSPVPQPGAPAHTLQGYPIGSAEIYIAPRYAGLEARVRASPDTLVSTVLETYYGEHIKEVVQDLCAVPLPDAAARRLGVELDAPGLRIVRRYFNLTGEVVEVSITYHPAERFSLQTRLTRSAP
jgi:GntR family transcriptional regulator